MNLTQVDMATAKQIEQARERKRKQRDRIKAEGRKSVTIILPEPVKKCLESLKQVTGKNQSQITEKAITELYEREIAAIISKLKKEGKRFTYKKIADFLNKKELATATGGHWDAITVRKLYSEARKEN